MRTQSYLILEEFLESHVHINLRLKALNLDAEQVKHVTIRVYGYLQNKEFLEFQVWNLTEKKKLDPNTQLVLCMAMYEFLFLDSSPDYAIISEYQNLSKKQNLDGQTYIAYILNQKLAKFEQVEPTFKDEIKNLSIKYSLPKYLVKMFSTQYSDDYTLILKSLQEVKDISARVIKPLINPNDFTAFEFEDLVRSQSNIIRSKDFFAGNLMIQDLGSYLVTKYLNPTAGDVVLDLCAAPGSKTLHLSQFADIVANEINESRLKVLADNLEKYDITNVKLVNQDATIFESDQTFSKILVDVPCSGIGCLASKPEIKYYMTASKIKELITLQRQIFDQAIKFLKADGEIVYSTCSLNFDENQNQIAHFCEKYHLEVVKEPQLEKYNYSADNVGITLLPNTFKTDGFYMCKLKRIKND